MPAAAPHPGPARLRAALDAWARAAGLAAMPADGGIGGPGSAPAADLLHCRRIGWREPRRTGRAGDGMSVLCDVLVTAAEGSDEALGLLASLYAEGAQHLEECVPVPAGDALWKVLGLVPRPALRASLRLEIRAAGPDAPAAVRHEVTVGPLRPLSGRVQWRGKGVPGVTVAAPLADPGVRTDARGAFRLPHVEGDELILRKGDTEMRHRLTGEADVIIELEGEG